MIARASTFPQEDMSSGLVFHLQLCHHSPKVLSIIYSIKTMGGRVANRHQHLNLCCHTEQLPPFDPALALLIPTDSELVDVPVPDAILVLLPFTIHHLMILQE